MSGTVAAKSTAMLAALVDFLEVQRREGAFDREYVKATSGSSVNITNTSMLRR